MADVDELRQQFARDMITGVRELAKLGYDASIFTRMLADHEADEVARRLVLDRIPSYGLWRLKELDKLDMSVEMMGPVALVRTAVRRRHTREGRTQA